jgi:hypothetical protein
MAASWHTEGLSSVKREGATGGGGGERGEKGEGDYIFKLLAD